MPDTDHVAAVRRFSRFYTRQLGLLDEGLLRSRFTLTEARVLYELACQPALTASVLGHDLRLDAGYLSRILKAFEAEGLVSRAVSSSDGRQSLLTLTEAGRLVFEPLNQASRAQAETMLGRLAPNEVSRLVQAMACIQALMGAEPRREITFRRHRIGDIGCIASRQALIYAREYGWDGTVEVLAAEILAAFVSNFDPNREASWIAERDGELVGSVFMVNASDTVAKLRLLYVEPAARGLGLGRRLVDECVACARDRGYRTLTLWTNDVLVSARRIYQAAGFACVAREPHRSFGKDLVGETWELGL